MNILYYILVFSLGLSLGSFLNLAGNRLCIGQSINNPKRSYCEKCKHELSAIDLIPILSFLFNRGRCRYCNTKISWFYPITELLCGILYLTSYKVFGFSYEFLIAISISSLLIIVIASDINYLIIPDEVIITFSIIILIISLIMNPLTITFKKIISGILMFIFMYIFMLLGNFMFKKETLGGADIKLMYIIGFVVGPLSSLFVVFLSSLIALPVSLFLLHKNKENIIPFGPFLVIALLLVFFFKLDTKTLVNIFSLI